MNNADAPVTLSELETVEWHLIQCQINRTLPRSQSERNRILYMMHRLIVDTFCYRNNRAIMHERDIMSDKASALVYINLMIKYIKKKK